MTKVIFPKYIAAMGRALLLLTIAPFDYKCQQMNGNHRIQNEMLAGYGEI